MVQFVGSMRWAFLIILVGVAAVVVAVRGLVSSGGDHVGRSSSLEFDASKSSQARSEGQLATGIVKVGNGPFAGESQAFDENPKRVNSVTQFVDQRTGWSTAHDRLWLTQDGGASWQQVYHFEGRQVEGPPFVEPNDIEGLQFVDSARGWALAGGQLYETADGGRDWKLSSQPGAPGYEGLRISRIIFPPNSPEAWVGGSEYRPITGRDKAEGDLPPTRFAWGDQKRGQCVAIYHSNDRGKTWQRQRTPDDWGELYDVYVLDSRHGWACGVWDTLRFAGRRWDSVPTDETLPEPHCLNVEIGAPTIVPMTVYFFNKKVGWLSNSSGFLGHSTDGGASWSDICDLRTLVPNDPNRFMWYFEMIHFCTPRLGFALDNAQTLYRTDDGGATWRAVIPGQRIVSAHFLASETGWAIGDNGTYRIQVPSLR